MYKKIMLILALSLGLFGFDKSVSNGEIFGTADCPVCGMHIKKFYKTSHAIVYKDGTKKHFCSMVCLKKAMKGADIKDIYVADASSGKMINVKSATYVIGSDVPSTMGAKKSKIAFSSKADALAFQKKHGGEIGDFNKALNE